MSGLVADRERGKDHHLMRSTSKPITDFWRLLEKWNGKQRITYDQNQLAVLFGVKKSHVSGWKYGDSWPGRAALVRIADETEIDLALLANTILKDKKRVEESRKDAVVTPGDKGNQKAAGDS